MPLEEHRIVRLRVRRLDMNGVYSFGTGYVVARFVVLTAAHVLEAAAGAPVAAGQPCEVRPWGGTWSPAAVLSVDADRAAVWQVDKERDLALVNCTACNIDGRVRWGRLRGVEAFAWTAVGFPIASLADDQEVGRESEQLTGIVLPLSGGESPNGGLALTVDSRCPRRTASEGSGWAGLSGAAVFSGDHLVGVVRADSGTYERSLVAVRAEHILQSRALKGTPDVPEFPEDILGEPSAGEPAPPAAVPLGVRAPDPFRGATDALRKAGPSRVPIVVALETTDEELAKDELPPDERHLQVRLHPDQADRLAELADVASAARSVEAIVAAGRDVWAELLAAAPRIGRLVSSIRAAGVSQPVAWCARPSLLARLAPAVLLAHTGGEDVDGFMTLTAGAHYFTPVPQDYERRSIAPRPAQYGPTARTVIVGDDPDQTVRDVREACKIPVVVVVDAAKDAAVVESLASAVRATAEGATRATVAFVGAAPSPERIDRLLDVFPFVSVGDYGLATQELLRALDAEAAEHAGTLSMACVVAAVRGALVRGTAAERDARTCLAALRWSAWSWIGLPLLARSYREVLGAAFPQLMQLRSVASREWYFNRRKGILPAYEADALVRAAATGKPEDQFHLYLSGAGGTGKSCFLRYLHDGLVDRPGNVAVWYRVDAPNADWNDVTRRVREETVVAVRRHASFGPGVADDLDGLSNDLGTFLLETVEALRAARPGFAQLVVFVDQLERTFESSGEQPSGALLEGIAAGMGDLLKTVGVGRGVRLLIASRKEYLPDFLGSTRRANETGLEFNVLQTVTDASEQEGFVRTVQNWCHDNGLVDPSVSIDAKASVALATKVDGHPLSLMLALIELLSEDRPGRITERQLMDRRPWERLFALDLEAADRDELHWYFMLGMAHARTEIVGFPEVWWRLRMVNEGLTRRADQLQPKGVVESLWLLGHVGRTIHLRSGRGDVAAYVEFFHANLRDYILRNVLSYGGAPGDLGLDRRRRNPEAWRALDRLAAHAHEWDQTRQLLAADDVRILMLHHDQVIEPPLGSGESGQPFELLFLRDPEDLRADLCRQARECFVLSALVHDNHGRTAFEALEPDADQRVRLCRKWLMGPAESSREPLLRYLLAQQVTFARATLVGIVLDTPARSADLAPALAAVLADSLTAARFRNAFIADLLTEDVRRPERRSSAISQRSRSFVAACCNGDRDAFLGVAAYCTNMLGTGLRTDGAPAAPGDVVEAVRAEDVDAWLASAAADLAFVRAGPAHPESSAVGVGLVIGAKLAPDVGTDRLETWSRTLRERLGVPFPELRLLQGEVEDDEIELRAPAGHLASGRFMTGRVCITCRDWKTTGRPEPTDAVRWSDVPGGGDLLWLTPPDASELPSSRDFDTAVVDWLERHARRSFDQFFTPDLVGVLVHELEAVPGALRLASSTRRRLGRVIVQLVEEGFPLGPKRNVVLDEIVRRLEDTDRPEDVAGQVRKQFRADLCLALTGETGRPGTLLLDPELEAQLADLVRDTGDGTRLRLDPEPAARLAAAVRRSVARLQEDGAASVVVMAPPDLRRALAVLLRQFDVEVPVLSFEELAADDVGLSDFMGGPDLSAES